MAKFDFGDQTSFDLEDGEFVVFASTTKDKMNQEIQLGRWELDNSKTYYRISCAITNKRVVTVPYPPNKKNKTQESIYYSQMKGLEEIKRENFGNFYISTNEGSYFFNIGVAMNALNIFKLVGSFMSSSAKEMAIETAKDGSHVRHQGAVDQGESFSKHQAAYNKDAAEYDKMIEEARSRMGDSTLGKVYKWNDFLVSLITQCMEKAKKG
jgi:hypothetical protein